MKYQIMSNQLGGFHSPLVTKDVWTNGKTHVTWVNVKTCLSGELNTTIYVNMSTKTRYSTPPKSHMEPAPQKGETSIYYKTSILSPHVLVFRGVYRDPTPTSPKTSSRKFMLPAFLKKKQPSQPKIPQTLEGSGAKKTKNNARMN